MAFRPLSTRDMRMLVATVYLEAANQPDAGQAAVAQVILNRAFDGRRGWAGSGVGPVERVVLKRKQFSCWNGNRAKLLARFFVNGDPDQGWLSDATAQGARETIRAFLSGKIDTSQVEECSHYINPATAPRVGSAVSANGWAANWRVGVEIADHVFLRPDQLNPPERAVEPVRVHSTPAVRIDDPPWFVKKLKHYGRRAWSAITALVVTGALSWDDIAASMERFAAWVWDALLGLSFGALPSLPDRSVLLTAGGVLLFLAVALSIYQHLKEKTDEELPNGRGQDQARSGRKPHSLPVFGPGTGSGQPVERGNDSVLPPALSGRWSL